MQNALETSSSETTSAKLLLAAENLTKLLLALEFSDFSAANRSFADADDVSRAFCIPPIYTKNFDEKHFFFNKFKYFRSLFMSKNYLES